MEWLIQLESMTRRTIVTRDKDRILRLHK